jgi:16S rRNA C967 or C1407 C5-methylase (RsmB/RsmF family)/NOL1/NOP2/fmu family ribosome biogenesis protein
MFPVEFKRRIAHQSQIDTDLLFKALSEPSPVSIRVNPKKWDKRPLTSEPVPWCDHGWYLESRPSFTCDPVFHAGCYYPQEASGMFLEQVFKQVVDSDEYIRILDLCGAPGGKSTHLSSLIGENGLLVTNEVIRSRALILAENLTKWGLSNAVVTQNDPSAFSRLHGFFDLILVDAPCSGEGMFRNKAAISEWSEDNTALCSERQKRILMDVWPALKENGILIYSTCTFNPGENEKIIKWLTGRHEAVSILLDLSGYEGITEIDYQGIHGYGFYPGKIRGEGLFISVLRKNSRHDGNTFKFKSDLKSRVTKEEKIIFNEWTLFSEERLMKSDEDIYALPCSIGDYNILSKYLKVIKSGTRICTVKKKNYLPSHEMSMSVYMKKNRFPIINLDLNHAISYLHRENIILGNAEKGWNIVRYNEVNLGFLNNIGNRINNYYPIEWRIRMNIPQQTESNVIKWASL